MTFLLTGVGARGVETVRRLLDGHPDLFLTAGRDYVGGWRRLAERAVAQSKHPDRPWDPDAPGVVEVCAEFLHLAMDVDGAGRLRHARVHGDADVAYLDHLGDAARAFPGLRLVLVIEDGRVDLPEGPDPAVHARARAWAARFAALEDGLPDVPIATVDLARAQADPLGVRAELYGFLGLDAARAPAPGALPAAGRPATPAQDAAFRAVPEADVVLRAFGWADGPPPAGHVDPDPAGRLEALRTRLAEDGADGLAALLAALGDTDDPALLALLLDQGPRPEAHPYLARARRHPDPRVRGALARWLVAAGLDHEAAEAVSRVHRTRWFEGPTAA